MPHKDLQPIFNPRSIAVIGASRTPGSVGYAVMDNLINAGFTGVVYPVNPKARAIRGVRSYPSMLEIPDEVDLAVVIVPAPAVPNVMEQLGERGVKGAVIISAGFKETGAAGAALEADVVALAHKYHIATVGPNCLGVINTDTAVALNASFAKGTPDGGNIAFISQSGALATAVLDYAKGQNFGFSKVVSLGNKADVNENDFLYYLWHDPATSVILLYLEDLADGAEFIKLGREMTGEGVNRKPILALKSGRTPQGAKAASSHTGSLAGSDEVYEAVFMQGGVLRVETVQDLFQYATAFANQPLPHGRRVAVVTNAGGPGIMTTDAIIRRGLHMAELSKPTREVLKEALPAAAAVGNPVDVLGDAHEDRYRKAIETVIADPNVDGVIVVLTPQAMTKIAATANAVVEADQKSDKTILATFMGVVDVSEGVDILRANHVPTYTFPEEAVRAFAAMARYTDWVGRPRTQHRHFDVEKDAVTHLLATAPRAHGFIPTPTAFKVLEGYGLPTLPWGVAHNAAEAVQVATNIGFPVVLKIMSPDIIHKFDVGGIQLNLQNETEVQQAHELMMRSIAAKQPDARLEGVFIQKMMRGGREVLLGMKHDPQFGPVLVFGLGGIYVELLKDVTFRVAPIREYSAKHMIQSIRTYKLLEGARGEPPADVDAIADSILRLSQLAVEQPLISELDVNPMLVMAEGHGAYVADARIAVQEPNATGNH